MHTDSRSPTGLMSAVAMIILIVSSPAAAVALGDEPAPPRTNRWERVVTIFIGGAHTVSSDLTISQPPLATQIKFSDVSFEGRSFKGPLYYGYRVGVFPPRFPFLGFEAEFIHLKVYSDPNQIVRATGALRAAPIARELHLGEVVQDYSISHGVNLLLFNAVVRSRIGRSQNHSKDLVMLTARIGAGLTVPHTESTIEFHHQEQYETGNLAWQGGAGVELHLWRGMYGLGEYKFTRTRQQGKVFSGEAGALLRSHHGVFGVSYHF